MASADGTRLTPDSMLQAGSVSKAVTDYAAHRLAAVGRLDLDADVNENLTSWQLPRVRGWQPAAHGHHGGEPVPGGWRNQPDVGAVGLWTTPSDMVRFARAVSRDQSVQMLDGHPVEPRMGTGVFPNFTSPCLVSSQSGFCRWHLIGGVCRAWPGPRSPSMPRTACAYPSTAATSTPGVPDNRHWE